MVQLNSVPDPGTISELSLRFMGGLRFPVYAVHRIANTRRYRGRISYLEAADGEGKQSSDDADEEYPSSLSDPPPESWKTEEDEFIWEAIQ